MQDPYLLAERLKVTWGPFFNRFGKFTDVQLAGCGSILDGKNVLLISPTSSGKTEAVCAPLVERNILQKEPWRILYVTPTRALTNDLFHRLETPLCQLGLKIIRRTGDHPTRVSEDARIIITTPESFDSMLCRGNSEGPENHFLRNVRAIVLDEIHLLYGTPRGEQLRWLIHRLRRLISYKVNGNPNIQIIALSATVPNPEGVCHKYLGDDSVIIAVKGGREIVHIQVNSASTNCESKLRSFLSSNPKENKILIFSNTRNEVEKIANSISHQASECGYLVRAHHGSLSKELRESAEKAAMENKKIILSATSTLEIGIDIGDIDLVILNNPPWDVMSFLQRIGRGNRRTNTTVVMLTADDDVEMQIQECYLKAACDGWMPNRPVGRNLSVIRQQIASYIFQSRNGKRSRNQVEGLFLSLDEDIPISDLIDRMINDDELVPKDEWLLLGERWEQKAQQLGAIHTNIISMPGGVIKDEHNGTVLMTGIRGVSGTEVSVGGKKMAVRSHDPFTYIASEVSSGGHRTRGSVSYAYKPGAVSRTDHSYVVRHFLNISDTIWPFIDIDDSRFIFHMCGGEMIALLHLLDNRGLLWQNKCLSITDFYIETQRGARKPDFDSIPESLRLNNDEIGMCSKLLLNSELRRLPESLIKLEIESRLIYDRLKPLIANSEWLPAEPAVDSFLRGLVNSRT